MNENHVIDKLQRVGGRCPAPERHVALPAEAHGLKTFVFLLKAYSREAGTTGCNSTLWKEHMTISEFSTACAALNFCQASLEKAQETKKKQWQRGAIGANVCGAEGIQQDLISPCPFSLCILANPLLHTD